MHFISGSYSVTVNNGSGTTLDESSVLPTAAKCVMVTPLTCTPDPTPVNTPVRPQLISKVLIKAFTKRSRKDPKILTLEISIWMRYPVCTSSSVSLEIS